MALLARQQPTDIFQPTVNPGIQGPNLQNKVRVSEQPIEFAEIVGNTTAEPITKPVETCTRCIAPFRAVTRSITKVLKSSVQLSRAAFVLADGEYFFGIPPGHNPRHSAAP